MVQRLQVGRSRPRSILLTVLLSLGLAVGALSAITPARADGAPRTSSHAHYRLELVGYKVINGKRYPNFEIPGLPPLPAYMNARMGPKSSPSAAAASTFYTINSFWSLKCVDDPAGNTSNGIKLIQWDCHYPATNNQSWGVKQIGTYTDKNGVVWPVWQFILKNTNQCMEALNWGTNNGADVDIWSCGPTSSNHSNQWWIPANSPHATWLINLNALVKRGQDVGLDVECDSNTNNARANGARLQLWQITTASNCSGENQEWFFAQAI